jgi:hypothetical protein
VRRSLAAARTGVAGLRLPINVRLFSMPGSYAATTGQLPFDHKGIDCKRTDLLPVVSWVVLKAFRFPGVTVPAAKIDGERVQGTRAIARELERLKPEPPLFPRDEERRRAVEEAERFGDEELQQKVRGSSFGLRGGTAADLSATSRAQRSGCRTELRRDRQGLSGGTPAVLPPEWLEPLAAPTR